jgi:membrane-bound lytic murein transglycosylase B
MAAVPFDQWLEGVKAEARGKGISESIIQSALSGIQPIPKVVSLDRKQPEGKMTFDAYKKRVISQARIDQGRRMMQEHKTELERASAKYGVPPQYIVALWGVETSYGNNTGGFGVIPALATLAHDGRRSEFFRSELMHALQILDEGHITLDNMKGSWAGAMGQNQFMPSSFKTFAVDGNNDGRRDIWTSLPDVFASTANYLSRSGWQKDQKWGRKVVIPQSFPQEYIDLDVTKDLQTWNKLGLKQPDGTPIPVADIKASLIQMDGPGSQAYLVYDNFRVILKWNKSRYFGSSVGLLADLIAQPAPPNNN